MSWAYGTIRISAVDADEERMRDIVRHVVQMVADDRDYDIDYDIEIDLEGGEYDGS
jgi:hypothetical protein